MADGSTRGFDFGHEIIVDLFAGGGGASLGIEQAFGRSPDVAVNHSADAIAMHQANHPNTVHMQCDVFEVDPLTATGGRQVGLLWASPDCKHFSKAKGGKPRSKKIRSLAWVVVKWAKKVHPRVIMLENVEEFVTWGPLGPDHQPDPKKKGQTFRRWVAQLRGCGYKVEWKELRACDYGAPTIRKRFFLIARCDGRPIVWPAPTRGKPDSIEVRKGKRLPWRTAAECIDFSLPCPSIFLTREEGRAIGVKRPLAEATMKRIAKGVKRFVLDAAQPFIVRTAHGDVGTNGSRRWGSAEHDMREPLPTVTASRDFALATAFLTKYRADNAGSAADVPFPTITANGDSDRPGGNPPLAVVAAHLEQANAGNYTGDGRPADAPMSTVLGTGSHQRLVTSSLLKLRGDNVGSLADTPLHTISAQGLHHAEVRAFLIAYYGNEKNGRDCADPMGTVVSRERFGLVTVDGTDYAIADIGLRMLTPRELFRAQGFPDSYVIDRGENGRRLPKDAQVRACGNSVCPPLARALVSANLAELIDLYAREAA
jgi:DNA (cytosine-5)-methyltransferase 1